MHVSYRNFSDIFRNSYRKITPLREIESTESPKFVSHKAKMSCEFDSRKDSHSTKFEWRPEILVKLSFRELSNSSLSDLSPFHNMAILLSQKDVKIRKVGCKFMGHHSLKFCVPQCELICCKNDVQGSQKYAHHRE